MIKIMLVAGKNSKQLAKFLEQRGTFSADFVYTDLYNNLQEITKSVIKVDKFVYVFQQNDDKDNTSIRLDMQALREMLLSNKFFKADEILFLCGDGDEYTQAKKYFSAVVEECGVTNAGVRTLDGIASFSSVYDNLIGVTVDVDFKNKYRNLYRRGKGDDASIAYEPKNDRNVVIEPFDYLNIEAYEKRRSQVSLVEAKENIIDGDDYEHFVMPNLSLEGIDTGECLGLHEIVLVTGSKHAGKKEWALQLATAARFNGKRVMVIDFTKSQGIADRASKNELGFKSIEPLEFLQKGTNESVCIISYPFVKTASVFCGSVIQQLADKFDCGIVVTDLEELPDVYAVLKNYLTCCISVTFDNTYDAKCATEHLASFQGKKILIIRQSGEQVDVSAEEMKLMFPNWGIIKPFVFKNYKNVWLYSKMIGDVV